MADVFFSPKNIHNANNKLKPGKVKCGIKNILNMYIDIVTNKLLKMCFIVVRNIDPTFACNRKDPHRDSPRRAKTD